MNCTICLNLQNDGVCARFGKAPPPGFADRCRHYVPDPDAPAEPEPTPEHAQTATCDGTDRWCRAEPCPYLLTGVPPGDYCTSSIREDADGRLVFSHLLLQDDTPCPRNWTI